MNLHDWIDELCDALDIEVEIDESLVLDVARDAAHEVMRPAAPITTFLLGYALAEQGGSLAELERLSAAATGLAKRWDRPAEEVVRTGEQDEDDETKDIDQQED